MIEKTLNPEIITAHVQKELFNIISADAGTDVATFISENIPLEDDKSIIYYPEKGQYDQEVNYGSLHSIIDLRKINYARDINNHFISINKLLPQNGVYTGCFESYDNRKVKFSKKLGKFLLRFVWTLDLVFNRVLPKLNFTRKLYNAVTHNRYHVISLAETLGRAIYCGFEVLDFKVINDLTYFSVVKTSDPKKEEDPSYGPLFKMKRVGKEGKMIGVYKLRTMHPYSEYLHSFIINRNGYNEFGKVRNDFRVTEWSKIVRKLYLDELPQIINVLKGEMNLVGVRPLGLVSFNLLPEDLKKERIKYKPGCIPPYIALNKKGLNGVLDAERIYLNEMKNNALKTNIKYFFRAVTNLICLKVSSN